MATKLTQASISIPCLTPCALVLLAGIGCSVDGDVADGSFAEQASEDASSLTAGAPTQLRITGPTAIGGARCHGGFSVSARDAAGNLANVSVNVTVRLGLQGPKSPSVDTDENGIFADGVFYTDSACTRRVRTGLVISAGSSSKRFFFRDNLEGPVTISASSLTTTSPAIANAAPLGVSITMAAGLTANISVGPERACAVVRPSANATSGGVYCWGAGKPKPRQLQGFSTEYTKVAVGWWHVCALNASGGVKCTGYNHFGQLGRPGPSASDPVQVSGLTNGAVEVRAGLYHSCARMSGGAVKCWGYNQHGTLGNGANTDSDTPVDVVGMTDATSIAAGGLHTCAVASGQAYCWGGGHQGQLGNGAVSDSNVPVRVSNRLSESAATASFDNHSCAILQDGAVQCWGTNSNGELGTTQHLRDVSETPVFVQGASNVAQVSAGVNFTCVKSGGGAYCFGKNDVGQLGNGSTDVSINSTPSAVVGLSSGVTQISAGYRSACALVRGGARCWGENDNGLLGDGTRSNRATPVQVFGLASTP